MHTDSTGSSNSLLSKNAKALRNKCYKIYSFEQPAHNFKKQDIHQQNHHQVTAIAAVDFFFVL